MKAILEFDLPEDKDAFRMATNAERAYYALDDIRQYLRHQNKYVDEPDGIEKIYKMFHQILEDNYIELL